MSRTARAAGFLVLLVTTLFVLRRTATGDLAAPPFTSLDDLRDWVDVRTPVAVAMALVRMVAEVAGWYVLVVSVLHGVAVGASAEPLHAVADAIALPGVRRAVHAALGLGLVVVVPAAGRAAVPAPAAATMMPSDLEPRASGTATMRPVLDTVPETGGTASMVPLPEGRAVHLPPEPAAAVATSTVWRVAPGESFWSIAEDAIAEHWQRAPTAVEIDPYWRALIAVNRDRLVDPDDPDLLLPGQVLDLPAPPAVRRRVQN